MTKTIAWLEPEWGEKICPEVGYEVTMTDDHPKDLCWIPLYSHPPQNTAQAYLKGFDEGCKSMSARNKAENIGCLGMPVNVPVTPPYKELKAINDTQAYPSIADQLDILYHSGFDAWKSAIQAVKKEFSK